MAIRHFHRK